MRRIENLIRKIRGEVAILFRSLIPYILFFTLAFFVFRKLILSPGTIFQHESIFPPFTAQLKQFLLNVLHSWGSQYPSFGQKNFSHPSALYLYLLLYLSGSSGVGGDVVSKLAFFLPVALAGCTMFYLCRQMEIDIPSSMLAGIFYQLVPFIFERSIQGHWTALHDYSLIPLVIVLFIRLVERRYISNTFGKSKTILLLSLVTYLSTQSLIAISYITVAFFVYALVGSEDKKHRWSARHFLISLVNITIVLVISFGLFHTFWFEIYLTYFEEAASPVSTIQGFLPLSSITWTRGESPLITLRALLDGFAFSYAASSWGFWQILSFALVILAFSASLFKPRDKRTIFFGALVIIGVTLASGTMGMLGEAYVWLIENIPPFRAFWEPGRWNPLIAFGYAGLIAMASSCIMKVVSGSLLRILRIMIAWLTSLPPKEIPMRPTIIKAISSSLVFMLICSMILGYGWPNLTGDAWGMMQTYDFSKYRRSYEWLHHEIGDFRVLSEPEPYPLLYSDQKVYWPQHDPLSSIPMDKDGLSWGHPYMGHQFERFLYKIFYEGNTQYISKLLKIAGVKYIIFDANKRSAFTEFNPSSMLFPEESYTNSKLNNTFSQQKGIALFLTDGSLEIYNNTNTGYQPRIFPINQIGLLAGDLSSLISLSYIDNLELNDIGLVFINQLSPEEFVALSRLPSTKIIIQDDHFLDVVFALIPREAVFLPINYVATTNPCNGWALAPAWYNWYAQAQLERIVFTMVESELTIPFFISQATNYDLCLYSYFGPEASRLKLSIDDLEISKVTTRTDERRGFRWLNFGQTFLAEGKHLLKVKSEGGDMLGPIVIVSKDDMTNALRTTSQLVKNKAVTLLSEFEWQFPIVSERNYEADALANGFKLDWVYPEDEPYFMDIANNSWVVALNFHRGSEVEEVYTGSYFFNTSYDIAEYREVEIKFRLSDPVNTQFLPIFYIDVDNDGIVDSWIRITPWLSEAKEVIRGSIHDIFVPPKVTVSNGCSIYRVSLLDTMERFLPDRNYKLLKIVIQFYKTGGDFSGNNAGYRFLYLNSIRLYGNDKSFSADVGIDASQANALLTFTSAFNYTIYVPKNGTYNIKLRAASMTNTSNIKVEVGGSKFEVLLSPFSKGLKWYEIGDMYLQEGLTNMSFHLNNHSRFLFDQIMLINETQMLTSQSPPVVLSYQRIHPAKYFIFANASQPFYLFFSESYDNWWRLYLDDGSQIRSFPGYSFGNMFYVNRTGELKLTLETTYERTYSFQIWLSLSALLISLLFILASAPLIRIPNFFKKFFFKK